MESETFHILDEIDVLEDEYFHLKVAWYQTHCSWKLTLKNYPTKGCEKKKKMK